MEKYLKRLPKEIHSLIYLSRGIASLKDMPAYLVGGFVRDLLLGEKNFDLDIVVEGDGIVFAAELARLLKAKLIRHLRFGTATVSLPGSYLKIDVATARKEFYPEPAHLPVVKSSSLKDDHFRRDFTINAMAISITGRNFGQLIDFFGGREDLRLRKIRILHDLSFIDDPTRILRAIRFEQRYNFKIEADTLRKLKKAVKLGMLGRLKQHRIRDELILILKEKHPIKTLMRIQALTGFDFLDGKIKLSGKTRQFLGFLEKEINSFNKRYSGKRHLDSWLIYLIGLLDPLDAVEARNVCRVFGFRKGEEKRILDFKNIDLKLISGLSSRQLNPSKVYRLLVPLSYEVIIALKAKYKNNVLRGHIDNFLRRYNDVRIHTKGQDLRKIGIVPGPLYQAILNRVFDAKLDGLLETKEEESVFIMRLMKNK